VSYRKPVKFVANDGADVTSQIQDPGETKDTIVINNRKNVAFSIPTQDLTLTIEQISERYIQPASIVLANQIDADGLALYKDIYNAEGTAGTTPNTFALLGSPSRKLDNFAVPQNDRKLVLNPAAHFQAADVLKSLYNPQMVSDTVRKRSIGMIALMDTYMDQNVKSHTKGVATGTPLTNGTNQTGNSLVTDGWTNSTTGILKLGDIFTIADLYAVNPVSKQSTGELQQFTVIGSGTTLDIDVDSGASTGPATILISPPITTSGAYQTVTGPAVDNKAIVVVANHAANLAFNKNAFALVTVPIEVPESATGSMVTYKDVSIRYIKWYDGRIDEQIYRLDILYGWKTIYPEYACRLLG
jgi:hypothetical protein